MWEGADSRKDGGAGSGGSLGTNPNPWGQKSTQNPDSWKLGKFGIAGAGESRFFFRDEPRPLLGNPNSKPSGTGGENEDERSRSRGIPILIPNFSCPSQVLLAPLDEPSPAFPACWRVPDALQPPSLPDPADPGPAEALQRSVSSSIDVPKRLAPFPGGDSRDIDAFPGIIRGALPAGIAAISDAFSLPARGGGVGGDPAGLSGRFLGFSVGIPGVFSASPGAGKATPRWRWMRWWRPWC